jgi:tagatose-6-phosphate ketose/aldose isomerase
LIAASPEAGFHTRREIFQQPELWPTTLACVDASGLSAKLSGKRVLFTGAGTSAYAAHAIAVANPHCQAAPTTDILVDAERIIANVDAVVSIARSGDSPESAAVVERVRSLRPEIPQFAITCNPDSKLTRAGLDGTIFLDPRSNDQSLVMTSAFSNLVLAGLALLDRKGAGAAVAQDAARAQDLLPQIDKGCRAIAGQVRDRIVILSSSPLFGWADEARLKVLEMTAGAYPVIAETFLGLRHGPMSFVREDTLVLALLSSDPQRRLYERDLLKELRAKKLGTLAGVADPAEQGLFDTVIPAVAPALADVLRTPFEIIAPQLLGYHLSLMRGLNPDNPSPQGVIHRVVQGVTVHSPGKSG